MLSTGRTVRRYMHYVFVACTQHTQPYLKVGILSDNNSHEVHGVQGQILLTAVAIGFQEGGEDIVRTSG